MLERCNAFVVAPDQNHASALVRLARRVGFTLVVVTQPTGEEGATAVAPRWPLNFFLVDYMLHDDLKKAVLAAVRRSQDMEVRFAPVVLIIDDCPFERILWYVEFGFDDIISLPEKADLMGQRLSRQLGHPYLYVQTADYLGPDRRRLEIDSEARDHRRTGLRSHIRYTIRRDPERGVEILHKVLC